MGKFIRLACQPSQQEAHYHLLRCHAGLSEICHEHSVPLIVDEAHGAHLGLLSSFPASAMQQGADIAVQSTHKTLSALGQASMLHCQGDLVSPQRLSQTLRLLQVGLVFTGEQNGVLVDLYLCHISHACQDNLMIKRCLLPA